jgi:Ni,Fe-hydrogenase maturation factor
MPNGAVKTLFVGFGNVLLGDDGFGIEVIKRLACSEHPPVSKPWK